MSPRTILILTSSHLCRNPRVVKEATTLGAAGYDVTVMSVSMREDFERLDLELMRGLPFRRKVLDYRRENRSARFSRLFQRAGTWGARRLCRLARIESAQSLGPANALLRLARSHPADLTIAHTEIPLWAAGPLIRDGRRVAVDLEDWYSEDLLEDDRRTRPLRLLREAEAFALDRAVYTSVPSESMAAALAQVHHRPAPIVLRNTFPLQRVSRLDRPAGNEPPALVWFSQTIGPGRGLERFLATWALTQTRSRVHLMGAVSAEYRDELRALVPDARRNDLRFIVPVAPDRLPAKLAEFDIGLALESRSPRNRDITISNKILQYLNAGLAVIATATAGQSEVMQAAPACGLLVPPGEPAELAVSLEHFLENRGRLRASQAAARAAAVAEFSWEHDAPRLLAAVEGALSKPVRP
ncbi:MAG: hypothetical protein JWM88_3303 [Verrucomicrobia bacterium]|nr:hypothetical protein [Verrucomicrobiota bacterium]